MLSLLVDYARTHGLTLKPGFKPKTVRWAIIFDQHGSFLNVQELGNPDDNRNRGRDFNVCPDLSQPEMKAGGSGCRHFLVDSVQVVALLGKNGDMRNDRTTDKAQRKKAEDKHSFFVSLLRQASSTMRELGAIGALLDSQQELSRVQQGFADKRFRPTDNVTFAITKRTPMFLVEDTAWHEWWRGFRQSLADKRSAKKSTPLAKTSRELAWSNSMRCLASGELVEPAQTQGKIEGLSDVGGLAMGDVLAAFKQESFCSYFLTQARNAVVSEEMAAAYRAGLNHLIKDHAQRMAGAKLVHWYVGETKVEKQEDPMGLLDDSPDLSWLDDSADEEGKELDALHRARAFLDAIRSGTKPRLRELEKYRFCAMILSANSGRVVTRDWMEGQFGELAHSIVAWYQALEITNISGESRAKSPKIERVITALLPRIKPGQKYSAWTKPVGDERMQLWHAATSQHVHLPYKVLSRIVPLHQAFMLSGDFEKALDERSPSRAANLSLLYARMALLKAYHRRKGDKNMQPYLNEEHPSPAYHCGRLMAVYADLQHAALGGVGAGVVQRYYAAASATPALILGRLSRGSQFHLNKLEGGLAYWYEQRLASIWGRIKDEPPKVLTLEEQSLFALGYYQQKASRKATSESQLVENHESKGEQS